MIDRVDEKMCTGCSACVNSCPRQAIAMKADTKGFLHPAINYEKCIQCELCEKICPILAGQNQHEERMETPQVYAAWTKDKETRLASTSGGLFTELAKGFFSDGGNVVGAIYNDTFLVEHRMIEAVEQIPCLRQSKYVQSDKKDIFTQVRNKLLFGERVLFVGAPCEVGGLYNFLGKAEENLWTIDYICLGCNSPKVYKRFLETLEERYQSKIKRVWFKNKTYGWNNFCTRVDFENGKKYLRNRRHDYFMRGYIGRHKYYTRDSCTACRYKDFPRQADISLADFWGVGSIDKQLDEDYGTSAVLVNSIKGLALYESILSQIVSQEMRLEDVERGNTALCNNVTLDPRREDFFHDLDRMPFDKLIDKYCPKGWGEMYSDFVRDLKMVLRRR